MTSTEDAAVNSRVGQPGAHFDLRDIFSCQFCQSFMSASACLCTSIRFGCSFQELLHSGNINPIVWLKVNPTTSLLLYPLKRRRKERKKKSSFLLCSLFFSFCSVLLHYMGVGGGLSLLLLRATIGGLCECSWVFKNSRALHRREFLGFHHWKVI